MINGIPYKKISGNGHKRSLEKIDDYLSIEGIQKYHVVICNTDLSEYNLGINSEKSNGNKERYTVDNKNERW